MQGQGCEVRKAIISAVLIIMLGCVLAMIPRDNIVEMEPDEVVDIALAAEDGTLVSDVCEKVAEFFAFHDIDNVEEAIEKGIFVVEYDDMTEEEAADFGYASYTFSDGSRIWYSKHELGSYTAHDDGSLNEFDEGYFVAHAGTAYGVGIAELYPGAVVNVNGRDVVIEGYTYDNYTTGYVEDLRDRIGWDKVCFQTCIDTNGNTIIYYGSYADGSTATPTRTAREEEYAARWAAHEQYLEENAAQVAKQEAENEVRRSSGQAYSSQAQKDPAKAEAEAQAAAQAKAAAEAAAIAKQQQAQAEADEQLRQQREQAAAAAAAAQQAAREAQQAHSSNSNSSANANAA